MDEQKSDNSGRVQNVLIGVLAAGLIGVLVYFLVLKDDEPNTQAQYAQPAAQHTSAAPTASDAVQGVQATAAPAAPAATASAGVNEEGGGTESIVAQFATQISSRDLFNTDGAQLSDVAAIIRQDRANYYSGEGDPDDQGDSLFSSKAKRAEIGAMLKRGSVDPSVRQGILKGSEVVNVIVIERNGVLEMKIS